MTEPERPDTGTRLIRTLWNRCIEHIDLAGNPHIAELAASGTDPELLARALRYTAYSTLHTALYELDEGGFDFAEDEPTGWQVIEVRLDDNEDEQPTGRALESLHDSLRLGDPTGNEGLDVAAGWQAP